jgi:hypothetical protein
MRHPEHIDYSKVQHPTVPERPEAVTPYPYRFFYIPFGSALLMAGDVAHAGGFCFGEKTNDGSTNHRLHLYFIPSHKMIGGISQSTASGVLRNTQYRTYPNDVTIINKYINDLEP